MSRIIVLILLIAAIVGGGLMFYSSTPARIMTTSSLLDLGEIDQAGGPVTATVDIRDDGGQPLELYRISTSCGCTTAQMDLSPLAKNETRTLTVTFDPMVHPDQSGSITRVVYIQSSDPDQPEIEIDVIGTVLSNTDL